MTSVGFVLGSNFHPSELVGVARAIEDNGFDSIWTSEDYFMTGGVSGSAVVLGATNRVKVGTGVLSPYVRHPALTAMEASTLASAFPGRFRLGLGAGVSAWLDQQGIAHSKPLAVMRESIAAIRQLLQGAKLTGDYAGFHFDEVCLSYLPEHVPEIFVGATGPKMTALAGEVADGLLLSVFASENFISLEREIAERANTSGTRTTLSSFEFFSLGDTVEKARDAARPVLADYLATGGSAAMTDAIGITEELHALSLAGGVDHLAKAMPDSWIDQLAICGDLTTCLERIDALGAAGADEIALAPIITDNLEEDIRTLGAVLRNK